jgi:hypothetical protein
MISPVEKKKPLPSTKKELVFFFIVEQYSDFPIELFSEKCSAQSSNIAFSLVFENFNQRSALSAISPPSGEFPNVVLLHFKHFYFFLEILANWHGIC